MYSLQLIGRLQAGSTLTISDPSCSRTEQRYFRSTKSKQRFESATMTNRLFEGLDVAENYAKYRPSYAETVTTIAIEYLHEKMNPDGSGRLPLALDVGCGTGHQSTIQLAPFFDRVIGTDVSSGQLEVAKKSGHPENVEFRLGKAEELPVPDRSVNFLQVALAVHWFDLPEFYKECDRVLTPGGVISVFCRGQYFTSVGHSNSAELDKLLTELVNVPEERGHFKDGNYIVTRRYTDPEIQIPYEDSKRVDNMTHTLQMTLARFISNYRSYSPFRRMLEAEPEYTETWFADITNRFLKAHGSDDSSTSFTCKVDIFMLLGRKPEQ